MCVCAAWSQQAGLVHPTLNRSPQWPEACHWGQRGASLTTEPAVGTRSRGRRNGAGRFALGRVSYCLPGTSCKRSGFALPETESGEVTGTWSGGDRYLERRIAHPYLAARESVYTTVPRESPRICHLKNPAFSPTQSCQGKRRDHSRLS